MPKAEKPAVAATEPSDAERIAAGRNALTDWLTTHIHNSPASRDTVAFNHIANHVQAICQQLDQLPVS